MKSSFFRILISFMVLCTTVFSQVPENGKMVTIKKIEKRADSFKAAGKSDDNQQQAQPADREIVYIEPGTTQNFEKIITGGANVFSYDYDENCPSVMQFHDNDVYKDYLYRIHVEFGLEVLSSAPANQQYDVDITYYFYQADGDLEKERTYLYSVITSPQPENTPPTLTNPVVSPDFGEFGDVFRFSITYTDVDNDAPGQYYIFLNDYPHGIPMYFGDGSYPTGKEFYLDYTGTESSLLEAGMNHYHFEFIEYRSGGFTVRAPESGQFDGPFIIDQSETVTAPTTPSGPSSGIVGQTLTFSTGGAVSNQGHAVEYEFDWGDGTTSDWGSATRSHSFSSSGTKAIKARARCIEHPYAVSDWSGTKSVSIGTYTLTISVDPSNGGSVSKNPDKTQFTYNESVQLTANANSSYRFDHWGGALGGTTNPQTLVMNGNKSVTAYFTLSQETITQPNAPSGPSSGVIGQSLSFSTGGSSSSLGHAVEYQFDWGDGNFSGWGSATQNHAYSASGTKYVKARARCATHTSAVSAWSNTKSVSVSYYTLTVSASPSSGGSVSKNPDKTQYAHLEQVQLTANSASGYLFDHWSGAVSGSSNPVTLTMDGNKTVTAYFVQSQETVTQPNTPTGPSGGKVGQSLTFQTGGSSSTLGHEVEYQFDWGDGAQSGWGARTQSHAYSIVGTKYIKARARCKTHTNIISNWSSSKSVTISYCALSISITPAGAGLVNKSPSKTGYTYNESVTLTAVPAENYEFQAWSGSVSSSSNPITIVMGADKNITANFEKKTESTNLLKNPDFDENMNHWFWLYFENARCTCTIDNNYKLSGEKSFYCSIQQGGTYDWYIQLNQYMPVEKGIAYSIRFKAKLEGMYSKDIRVEFQEDNDPYAVYAEKTVKLYNDVYEYGPFIVRSNGTDNTSRFKVFLGGDDNVKIYLDDFEVQEYPGPSEVSETAVDVQSPEKFMLYQNYPNPFNSTTAISYYLPDASPITLSVYDAGGCLVSEIFNGRNAAGVHTLNWDASGQATGLYFIKLQAGAFSQTRKCLFIK
ncbi:carbohydrate binding domain-containing protein [candidate division KSB1 bacterium]|nr:carbohydrate binding domain-containing protein [candidate division KSB1 bacterium]